VTGAAVAGWRALPVRMIRLIADLGIGGLLCATPVTSVLALGWISRQMAAVQTGGPRPGWVLGPPGTRGIVRAAGGLGANIRTGFRTLAGLAVWTLPVTLGWLGAWWAGWENSFNKGYEQAAVGPAVFLFATLMALPVLALLPFAAALGAREGRLGGFVDLPRVLRLAAAAGWRGAGLALMSVLAALPLFAFGALPVFVEQVIPGFATLPPADQAAIGTLHGLIMATYAFAALWALRHVAAWLAARPHATGRLAPLWLLLSALVWSGLPLLIVAGQFMAYARLRWISHPFFLLPWPG
jgi:hypothetical protein